MRFFSRRPENAMMGDANDQGDRATYVEVAPERVRAVLGLAAQDVDQRSGPDGGDYDPELLADAARQRRVARLLQSGGPATPETLRASIGDLREGEPRKRRIPSVGPLGAAWPKWTAGLAVIAAAAIAVVLVLGSVGGSGAPAAARVANVWKLPATGSVVRPNPADPAELDVNFHGTKYPNYHDSEGWGPVGTRSGTIDGTPVFTVYYATGARRAAYAVVAGKRVSVPAHASRFLADGLRLTEFRDGDRWVIVFENHGNSCVLIAAAPREKTWLVKLAVWRSGAVTAPA